MRAPYLPMWVLMGALAAPMLTGAAPAHPTDQPSGRFEMRQVGDGYLRFDSDTGALSMCQPQGNQWSCGPVPDDAKALRSEIDRLMAENKELQSAVKRLEALLRLPDEAQPAQRKGSTFRWPSQVQIEDAVDYMQRMLRKFKKIMRDLGDHNDERSL
jgi:hypothetical protein